MKLIIEEVADRYQIKPEDITGRGRLAKFAEARMLVYFIARYRFNALLSRIAESMARDHSTVMSGIKTIEHTLPNVFSLSHEIAERVRKRLKDPAWMPPRTQLDITTPEACLETMESILANMDRASFDDFMLKVMSIRGGQLFIIRPERGT